MLSSLIHTLDEAGKRTEIYRSPDGTRVLLLPHGGRALGLFAAESEENFFWTHSALSSVDSARAFYESDVWHNFGGDRTWLSPEVDLFFPHFPNLDLAKYRVPRQLDPGDYKIVRMNGGVRLVNRLTLSLVRSKQRVELEIVKWVAPAPNPLRYERGLKESRRLEYAGYTQH
ncbi:MAG: hypothetical protein HY236_06040, partial [Acidobacteria bacterium]|nr:hypothetical protein [Acidobacteriota bacterium]